MGYYLTIARRQDPGFEADHQTAAGTDLSRAASARMEEFIAWIRAQGWFPRDRSQNHGERSLAAWLAQRQREATAGALQRHTGKASPRYPRGQENPGQPPMKDDA